jgi:Methyltransferase domain
MDIPEVSLLLLGCPLRLQLTRCRPRPSFYDVALKHGTDKVTDHSYHNMYEKYLPASRDKRIKFLEIGLGCGMSYGPGKSYYTWLDYFPHVDLYYIEYDAACAEKWAANTTGATVFTGDHADAAFLERVVAETNAKNEGFDVIVDDGGHRMEHQITSLKHLWKAVKPGGIYFCEDLQTSYIDSWGGSSVTAVGPNIMMGLVKELLDDLNVGHVEQKYDFSTDILGVECMREICAFTKKWETE